MRRLGTCIVLLACCAAVRAGELFDEPTRRFADRLDLDALSTLPVLHSGRVTVLDTLAREQLLAVYGRQGVGGVAPAFAWMELYFNTGAYLDKPLVRVGRLLVADVAEHLDAESRRAFLESRRLPPGALVAENHRRFLLDVGRAGADDFRDTSLPEALEELRRVGAPKRRRAVDELLDRYWTLMRNDLLRVLPVDRHNWLSAEELLAAPSPASQPGAAPTRTVFARLRDAWRSRDASQVNSALADLRAAGRQALGPDRPSALAGRAEVLYNRTRKGTVLWVGFAVALVLLVVAAATQRRWARGIGRGVFALSTLALAAAFAVRWILSGRAWYLPPMMNQFEAVAGSAMLGAIFAFAMEWRRRQDYLILSAAFYATVAMLAGFVLPERMGTAISASAGILLSPIMAVHVSTIIIGHALAGMTGVTSAIYLFALGWRGRSDAAAASAGADLAQAAPDATLARIDRCNLIVAQLACWSICLGTVLGAFWGDLAWGRWWGWDPKETWALITALIYVAALHLRFVTPARSRGLVTAGACLIGCAAMVFNWFAVNYLFRGLHSYA